MAAEPGKRVSWVELYLDLIFALAVGQLAHVIVADPEMGSVWIAFGLFVTMWWTWIGFAVLYNREGDDASAGRALFLAASVPTGVAAVAIEPASLGHVAAFAIAMAVTRVLLAGARVMHDGWRAAARMAIVRSYVLSATLFTASIALHGPGRFVLWGIAIAVESSALLTEDRGAARRLRRDGDLRKLAPRVAGQALDAHHFAERFGLFLIILLGEVLISAGETAVEGHVGNVDGWVGLVGAMVLAPMLWWLYFNAAVEINLRVLEASGGSPTVARALFAAGHMAPAFALLLIASGVGLLLDDDPADIAYWLLSAGVGVYLIGTKVFLVTTSVAGRIVRIAIVVATIELGWLADVLSPHAFLWLVAAWTAALAALATRFTRDVDDQRLGDYAP